ncbi:MAG: Ldh family oxidoreductase [Rhodovibrio sp.]|nr:Ldh family oxidoreductase [Rhodovibrio sp.]
MSFWTWRPASSRKASCKSPPRAAGRWTGRSRYGPMGRKPTTRWRSTAASLADQPALSPDAPGAMLAFGGHKGSGLALICELLAGAMTGTGCARAEPEAAANGMVSILIDPTATGMQAGMAAEIERYLEFFTDSAPKDAGHPVEVPGAPERAARRARERDGIPLPQATWDGLVRVSRELDLPADRLSRARRTP